MSRPGAKRKSSRPAVRATVPPPVLVSSLPLPPESDSTTLQASESSPAARPSRRFAEPLVLQPTPTRVDRLPTQQLYYIWRQIERQPYFLDDALRDPYTLAGILMAPTSRVFLLETAPGRPVGLMYAHNIVSGVSAATAIAIWDRAAARQHEAIRTAMAAVIRGDDYHSLHKLYAHIALPNTPAHRLAERLGFKKEGQLRSALCYSGEWTDIVVYGVLAEELG